jgi:5-methylcytosine-specific restriction enzyme subunit McrC
MKRFVCYEYDTLRISQESNGNPKFTEEDFAALSVFYGEGKPYFDLLDRGIRFGDYVGVLQIGDLSIEVLPKADRNAADDKKEKWRDILIDMLRAVGPFNIQAPSSSDLQIKHNYILDLYIELFIKETEYLLHRGLVKKYRREEQNSYALKGNLIFSKQIQQNLVHQERFYVSQSTYDTEHTLHQLLWKTIRLLGRINGNEVLKSRIGALRLNFPEMPDIKATEAVFEKIVMNRKTEHYRNALQIARMLLLNYHPDLSGGRNNVLALMFEMNYLWEAFVYKSLLRYKPEGVSVREQVYKKFWKNESGYGTGMQADIVISTGTENFVLDTKWKNLGDYNPSPEDLRQLYTYGHYYNAQKVALVYPGESDIKEGSFYPTENDNTKRSCSVITLNVNDNILKWQQKIACCIFGEWLNYNKTV